ncbi:hypothetical protein, partial [Marinagarivorans algicola]|uniref:hypothetical protein n=1 Tax=Marinagarivorans algicola TaxID=1513270 RepID=UPI001EE44AAE
ISVSAFGVSSFSARQNVWGVQFFCIWGVQFFHAIRQNVWGVQFFQKPCPIGHPANIWQTAI